jgi:hypothetical protein
MVVDSATGGPNRAIIAYRTTHATGGANYYHIEVRSYNSAGTTAIPGFAAIAVTNNTTAAYHCLHPRISLADTGAAESAFSLSWFDGRFIFYFGYSIYAQQYNATDTAQWIAEEFLFLHPLFRIIRPCFSLWSTTTTVERPVWHNTILA